MAASNTLQPEPSSLRDLLSRHGGLRLVAPERKFHRNEFVEKTDFEGRRDAFAGKCVLIAATEQIDCARALIELDGWAARLVILPPGFSKEQIESVLTQAEVDALVSDDPASSGDRLLYVCGEAMSIRSKPKSSLATEWVLPTSGSTGTPKLVAHTLATLLGPIPQADAAALAPVWATFYDIRRYGEYHEGRAHQRARHPPAGCARAASQVYGRLASGCRWSPRWVGPTPSPAMTLASSGSTSPRRRRREDGHPMMPGLSETRASTSA